VESQLNWTAAKRAFPAAWLPLIFAAGIVVVLKRSGRHRVSQTTGTRPGTVAITAFCRKSNRAICPPGQRPGPAEDSQPLIFTNGTDKKTWGPSSSQRLSSAYPCSSFISAIIGSEGVSPIAI